MGWPCTKFAKDDSSPGDTLSFTIIALLPLVLFPFRIKELSVAADDNKIFSIALLAVAPSLHLPQAGVTYSGKSSTVVDRFDGHCKHRCAGPRHMVSSDRGCYSCTATSSNYHFPTRSRSCRYLELTLMLHEGTSKSRASSMYCAYQRLSGARVQRGPKAEMLLEWSHVGPFVTQGDAVR
ncbi:hypothetical protein EDD17DRAFT_345386 [Pisolithus thermaeus]|nr:hypothetical protein EDD17DRAFT_345386 [Pisolithus thermaeus]